MPLAETVGWCGAAVGTATTLVQALRVWREGTGGVNATTWSLFTLMAAFWLCFGVAQRSPEIVIGTLAGLPMLVWLLTQLEASERRAGLQRGVPAVLAAVWLPAALLGWNAGLLGIAALMAATRLPQLLELTRVRHPYGVSIWSWALGSTSLALWIGYYVGTGMRVAALAVAIALAANLSIVGLASYRRRTARYLHPTFGASRSALSLVALRA